MIIFFRGLTFTNVHNYKNEKNCVRSHWLCSRNTNWSGPDLELEHGLTCLVSRTQGKQIFPFFWSKIIWSDCLTDWHQLYQLNVLRLLLLLVFFFSCNFSSIINQKNTAHYLGTITIDRSETKTHHVALFWREKTLLPKYVICNSLRTIFGSTYSASIFIFWIWRKYHCSCTVWKF